MQCGCPECGILMTQAQRGFFSACTCPQCGYSCDICLGTNTVLSSDALRTLEDKLAPPSFAESAAEQNQKALDSALRYLGYKARTQSEVTRYLKKKGFSSGAVAYALERLQEHHYIDDNSYAQQYTADKQGKLSARMVEMKLQQRGIARETAKEAAEAITPADEYETALVLADKMLSSLHGEVREKKQKLTQRLRYRGFGFDTINSVLLQVFADEDE